MSGTGMFAPPEAEVIAAVACTWCAAEIDEPCVEKSWGALIPATHTHAQRWRDLWNATHDRDEQIVVVPAPRLR